VPHRRQYFVRILPTNTFLISLHIACDCENKQSLVLSYLILFMPHEVDTLDINGWVLHLVHPEELTGANSPVLIPLRCIKSNSPPSQDQCANDHIAL